MGGGVAIDKYGLDFKIAWPSGEWGSLAVEGGVSAVYKREIAAAADPAQRVPPILAELRDAQGTIVYSWTIKPPVRMLPPNEKVNFSEVTFDCVDSAAGTDATRRGCAEATAGRHRRAAIGVRASKAMRRMDFPINCQSRM